MPAVVAAAPAAPLATGDAGGGLRNLNFVAAAAHAAAALGFGLLFAGQDASRRTVDLTKTTVDPQGVVNGCNEVDFPTKAVSDGSVDPAPLVVGFFAFTAAAHLMYGLDIGGWYTKSVMGKGMNPLRWVEYGVSASMMSVIIGASDGVRDRVSLTSAALATAAMQGQGFLVERALKQGERATWAQQYNAGKATAAAMPSVDGGIVAGATLCGWAMFVLLWYIILCNFKNVTTDAVAAGAPVPDWLGWIALSQGVFFASFGGVQVAQIAEWKAAEDAAKRGDKTVSISRFEKFEMAYIGLSFASKLSLAALLGFGLFQRANVQGCRSAAAAAAP